MWTHLPNCAASMILASFKVIAFSVEVSSGVSYGSISTVFIGSLSVCYQSNPSFVSETEIPGCIFYVLYLLYTNIPSGQGFTVPVMGALPLFSNGDIKGTFRGKAVSYCCQRT